MLESLRAALETGRRADRAGAPRARAYSAAWTAAWDTSAATAPPRRAGCSKPQGFAIEKVYNFNKAGAPPWWAYSRCSARRNINKPVLKIFDKTVWVWRRLMA